MKKLKPEDLAQLDRERFEALRKSDLIDLTERLRDLCIDLYERLNRNSSNSSKPPSSDDPFSEGKKQQSEDAGDDKCDQSRDEPNDGNSDEDAATAKNEEDETEKTQTRQTNRRSGIWKNRKYETGNYGRSFSGKMRHLFIEAWKTALSRCTCGPSHIRVGKRRQGNSNRMHVAPLPFNSLPQLRP